jgi:dihydrodipicolinate synthase/N-acetylneuraminate lyase
MQDLTKMRIDPITDVRSLKTSYSVSGIKAVQEALGRAGGPVRPPARRLEPRTRRKSRKFARKYAETLS